MGRNAKTQNKNKRVKEKRARKAARQAQYQKWAEIGQNTKSKRYLSNIKTDRVSLESHPYGRCGNPACQKCFDINFRPFLSKGKPKGMPQWMFQRWTRTKDSKD